MQHRNTDLEHIAKQLCDAQPDTVMSFPSVSAARKAILMPLQIVVEREIAARRSGDLETDGREKKYRAQVSVFWMPTDFICSLQIGETAGLRTLIEKALAAAYDEAAKLDRVAGNVILPRLDAGRLDRHLRSTRGTLTANGGRTTLRLDFGGGDAVYRVQITVAREGVPFEDEVD